MRATPDKVLVTNLDGGEPIERSRIFDGARWPGFEFIGAKAPEGEELPPKPHPWCLVVEGISEKGS
jgi:hypothetical protein